MRTSQHGTKRVNTYDRTKCWTSIYESKHKQDIIDTVMYEKTQISELVNNLANSDITEAKDRSMGV